MILGLLVTAAGHLSGHLGYGENPDTLEKVFFATNTRAAESLSFVAPIARTLELLLLWIDESLTVSFGIATSIGIVLARPPGRASAVRSASKASSRPPTLATISLARR